MNTYVPVGSYLGVIVEARHSDEPTGMGREFIRIVHEIVTGPFVGERLHDRLYTCASIGDLVVQAKFDRMFETYLSTVDELVVDDVVRRPDLTLVGLETLVRVTHWTSPSRGPVSVVRESRLTGKRRFAASCSPT